MRYIRLAIVAIQLSLFTCYSQTKVELHDISTEPSPIHVSGIVSVSDDASRAIRSYQVNGKFHNISNKDVALIIVRFASDDKSGPNLDLTYQKEYFFSVSPLGKAGSDDFSSALVRLKFGPPVSQPAQQSQLDASATPTATAETVFVQFVDGATWGDSEAAEEALAERRETLRELGRLENVLQDRGAQALKEELSKLDSVPLCIGLLVNSCAGKSDSCIADGLRSMIGTAQQRQHDMELTSSAATK